MRQTKTWLNTILVNCNRDSESGSSPLSRGRMGGGCPDNHPNPPLTPPFIRGENHYSILIYKVLVLVLLVLSASLTAQETDKDKQNRNLPEVIWRDTGDIASLNLFYGAGGKDRAPDPNTKFTFVEEDTQSSNPKFDMEDDQGVQWKVKLGQETQAETAATRLLWAAGYFVDEDYYLVKVKVAGMQKLQHGEDFVSAGGTVHGARLERKQKDVKKLGNWDWFNNPFLGKRELNGLRVMMSLLNNWDLKEINNSIYEIHGERRYLVTDLGATFGNTGNTLNAIQGFAQGLCKVKIYQKSDAQIH